MSSEQALASRRATSRKNWLSRRDFLKQGGVGLAGVAVLGASGCGVGGESSGKVVFTSLDLPGSISKLVDKFNEQNKGRFQVVYRAIALESQEYFDQLKTEFQAGGNETDVIGGNVPWTAEFAENGWIVDVSSRFPEGERSKFVSAQIQSLTYEKEIWGVPWLADAGLLFYRNDLLEHSGFSEPPKTWEALKEMAEKVIQDSGTRYGFVFQGANNESGVCNALEYIWTHGGDVLDGDKVIIDSPESAAGLATYHSMVTSGAAPKAVFNYTETESQQSFYNGDSVFIRYWPSLYGGLGDPATTKLKPEQVGIAPIPVAPGNRSYSTLGGWGMEINAQT